MVNADYHPLSVRGQWGFCPGLSPWGFGPACCRRRTKPRQFCAGIQTSRHSATGRPGNRAHGGGNP